MQYFWDQKVPKSLNGVAYDNFLRIQLHNRQQLMDAAALKHYKPPATHWNEFMMAVKNAKLMDAWVIFAVQRSFFSTVAVLPSMDLRTISIQHAQKILYNLVIYNLDYLFLKKHNKSKTQSLLGSHFKAQLADCTDMESIQTLVQQERLKLRSHI